MSLILKCEKGGSQIIKLFLDCISSESFANFHSTLCNSIKEKAQAILGKDAIVLHETCI